MDLLGKSSSFSTLRSRGHVVRSHEPSKNTRPRFRQPLLWLALVVAFAATLGGGLPSVRPAVAASAVSIGNGAGSTDGSYRNAQNLANQLVRASVTIQADTAIDLLDNVDLSSSLAGTPKFDLHLVAPTINISKDLNLGALGNLYLTANTLNLNGQITSGATLMTAHGVIGAASLVNVLSNTASIQQAIDASSRTTAATIQVSAGQYAGNLTITKPLTLRGNPGTASAGADPSAPEIFGTQAGGNVITVTANDVTTEGLHINSKVAGGALARSVNGIYASGVSNLTIRQNTHEDFFGSPGFATPGSTNVVLDVNLLLIDPASILIGNDPDSGDGTYLNAQILADNLTFTSINITADNNIDVVDDIDISTSAFGTPGFALSLLTPIFNLDHNMNMGTFGNLVLSNNTLNLIGKITSGGTLINPSRVTSTATQINVLADTASIQQGMDISSTTAPVTVNVSAGPYQENLTINKAGLTLRGDPGTAAPGADPNAAQVFGVQPGGDLITVGANGVTVEGLHLNALVAGGSQANSAHSISANSVTGITIRQNTLEGFAGSGISTPGSTGVTLDANLIVGASVAPTDIALSAASVQENQPVGTTVGSLSTTDLDAGDTFTYTLVSGAGSSDNGSFSINGNNLLTAASFDFETKSSYSIRVRTTDAGVLSFEKQFTIAVVDVNEGLPPSCTKSWAAAVDGLWSDAAKWAPSGVPTSGDDVCITSSGSYTVTLNGSGAAGTVTLGATGNGQQPMLLIQGTTTSGHAFLTSANGFTNHGNITFDGVTGGGFLPTTGAVLTISSGSFINAPDGSISVNPVGAPHEIRGEVVNNGSFTVASGANFNMGFGSTFNQNAGSLAVNGSFPLTNATLTYNGGSITGTMALSGATVV
ncbi:MAG TPA: cadherin domain-containing protein, partial [Dehalococcoidia bacterium]|nr:cadherin domain-containing protein [Dehalococcoidia bacterium]